MDLTSSKFSVDTPYKGLVIASILPVAGLAMTSPEAMLIAIAIAIPFSLLCMMLIGAPVYYLLKRLRILNFPLCIFSGVLCSVPGSMMFSPSGLPIEFSLSSYISFSLLGAVGGFVFWAVYARVHGRDQNKLGLGIGFALVAGLATAILYSNDFKTIEYVDGRTLPQGVSFVDWHERLVPVKVQGEELMARLAEQVPYISNCETSLSKWRDMFTHEIKYSVSHYPQVPRAHHFKVFSEEGKAKVPRECPPDGKVIFF
ncbi:hypothetical protein KUL42_11850 [Alteromonas sp. KUL42]|uniref:hypothetical protein n=1 Tax=Alteromonas sp. KUL42 TaxID=2480797 RepID=UPI0010359814|nr:hypothetical protein [Alteromonas sp. KUL42]TAP37027.1 hypothetical protein EYR97_05870 [Alteromonas sp. KUL42]GEA06424.1 hypothetical protein KUL42_11850 [Alteromonas sp. KUL42]